MRKDKVFSISVTTKELEEIEKFVKDKSRQLGAKISRNEVIRRATLAHIRFEKSKKSKRNKPNYSRSLESVEL